MRFVHFTTDVKGGAGIAALRLHATMLKNGLVSVLYNRHFTNQELNIFQTEPEIKVGFLYNIRRFFKNKKNGLISRIYNNHGSFYHSNITTQYRVEKTLQNHDIVILHWVADFLDYKTFFKNINKNQKLVIYVHDFNIILGRLHTLFDAERVNSMLIKYLEKKINQKKTSYITNLGEYKIIANSNFTCNVIKNSNIFPKNKLYTVYLGLPESEFTLVPKVYAKKKIGVNENDFLVLIAANDLEEPGKGGERFFEIFEEFKDYNDVKFIALGKVKNRALLESSRLLNYITWDTDEKSKIFSSADVLLSTSYEETFGQTIIEAYACATPTIVYSGYSALPEIVEHNKTGFIAKNSADVCFYIKKLKDNSTLKNKMGKLARETYLSKFTSEIQLKAFLKLLDNTENK